MSTTDFEDCLKEHRFSSSSSGFMDLFCCCPENSMGDFRELEIVTEESEKESLRAVEEEGREEVLFSM
jgi:hypothetical protein